MQSGCSQEVLWSGRAGEAEIGWHFFQPVEGAFSDGLGCHFFLTFLPNLF